MLVTKEDITLTKFGYTFTIPKGTVTTHRTACGIDDSYNFIDDLSWVPLVDGVKQYGLIHDMTYSGVSIPRDQLEKV